MTREASEVLAAAAAVEQYASHPIALAILEAAADLSGHGTCERYAASTSNRRTSTNASAVAKNTKTASSIVPSGKSLVLWRVVSMIVDSLLTNRGFRSFHD